MIVCQLIATCMPLTSSILDYFYLIVIYRVTHKVLNFSIMERLKCVDIFISPLLKNTSFLLIECLVNSGKKLAAMIPDFRMGDDEQSLCWHMLK